MNRSLVRARLRSLLAKERETNKEFMALRRRIKKELGREHLMLFEDYTDTYARLCELTAEIDELQERIDEEDSL